MLSFYSDYLDRVQDLHNDIKKSISGLTVEALDWKPQQEMNSFAVLITHLTGAERFWIGDMTGQESSDRNRDSEFVVERLDEAKLVQRLDDSLAYIETVLEKLTLDDFNTEIRSERNQRSFTIGWSLLHALEHTATHMGHMQVMRDMWDGRTHS
jgi:uncharacterized damage-inducible protein DinB